MNEASVTSITVLLKMRDELSANLRSVNKQIDDMSGKVRTTGTTAQHTALALRQVGSAVSSISTLMLAGTLIMGESNSGWQKHVATVLRFTTAATMLISVLIRLKATMAALQATQALGGVGAAAGGAGVMAAAAPALPWIAAAAPALPWIAALAAAGGLTYLIGKKLNWFANGGTVPGPEGVPSLAVVHGGEKILKAGSTAAGSVHLHFHSIITEESTLRKASALFQRYQRENDRMGS